MNHYFLQLFQFNNTCHFDFNTHHLDNSSPLTIPLFQSWIDFHRAYELTGYSAYSEVLMLDAMLANSEHSPFEYLLNGRSLGPYLHYNIVSFVNLLYELTTRILAESSISYSDFSRIAILNHLFACSLQVSSGKWANHSLLQFLLYSGIVMSF
jgi:hypothetical protein